MLSRLFSDRGLSAIALIIIGVLGWIFGGFILMIAAIFLIIIGIINIAKKSYDAGIISILIGIVIIFISRFLGWLIHTASLICIIAGIVLYLYYIVTKKSG